MGIEITRVETVRVAYEIDDIGTDENGFQLQYEPGNALEHETSILRIHTDAGVVGEAFGSASPRVADYLLGKNPLDRERHWSELRHALRHSDATVLRGVDVALWDFAGKLTDRPIHELLGTYRRRLPAYASTLQADQYGGLDSPESYADFAEECLSIGYRAFKIHGWSGTDENRDIDREVETVRTVGERVGDEMDLMIDPACEYETFSDAVKVGRACDKEEFLWYEDPFRDEGNSQHAHRRLRQKIDTPILQAEHIQGLEAHTDFVAHEATDLVRGDLYHGITGLMKVARVAEGLGTDVELHLGGPAMRHCMAAIRNTNYYEIGLVHPKIDHTHAPPIYAGDYADRLDSIDDDGTVAVPDGPGLGVGFDWDFIETHQIDHRSYE